MKLKWRKAGSLVFRASSFELASSFDIRTSLFNPHLYSKSLLPEDFGRRLRKEESQNLRSRRGFSRRFGCRRRRFCSRSRTGCFRCRWRTRGCWACRGFGCLGLLLARRKERGTGQNADVFFHSVNWKRHNALTDQSEQGSF
jgi:hypothetical protein